MNLKPDGRADDRYRRSAIDVREIKDGPAHAKDVRMRNRRARHTQPTQPCAGFSQPGLAPARRLPVPRIGTAGSANP